MFNNSKRCPESAKIVHRYFYKSVFLLSRVIFAHAHGPVDGGKTDEHEGDPPLPNEDANFQKLVFPAIILRIELSQSINLGLLIPENIKIPDKSQVNACLHQT